MANAAKSNQLANQAKPASDATFSASQSLGGVAPVGTLYGYARVSARDQNLARQLDALRQFGVPSERIFADKASGKDFERPAWRQLTGSLAPGDVLIVKSIDRFGRNYEEIQEEWRRIVKVRGAAVGTIFARCSELVMVLIYMYFRENTVGFRMHDCLKFDREMLPSYTRHSLPVLGNELLWGVGFVATSVIIGRIGSVFVAANSIAGVLNQLVFISVSGVANAAAVLTGKTIGEGSRGRVQKVANTLLLFSVLVGVFNCLLVLVIRPLFLLLYNVTPETYEAAYTIIGVLACLQLVLGIDVTCIVGILRGGGDTRTAFVYDCGALWLVSIPMGILAGLVLHLPVPLVYVCLKLDSPIKAFLSLLRIRSGKWIRNVTVQTSPMPPEEEAQRAAGME